MFFVGFFLFLFLLMQIVNLLSNSVELPTLGIDDLNVEQGEEFSYPENHPTRVSFKKFINGNKDFLR